MKNPKFLLLLPLAVFPATAQEDFPVVAGDLQVSLFAREPLVRNPCAIAFDAEGRLCVGMGPQYRNPKPDTPGDSVWILRDEDRDGVADGRVRFATGFNSIQGLAWRGRDLYIANAPELTIARDLDGDDRADEYVRVYTDLGNLEHALHGLNFGPDGKLYMSKGNSKGLTRLPGRLAPGPFRELWGVDTPPGTPDFPEPLVSRPEDYRKNYHHPADDWGVSGGVLRCDPDGSNLEIVSRGFRNPWDICFDDAFTWLGTDNDQTMGDKIFSPFYGAHFGWGHPWSYDWKGDGHLPTAPSSGPLFEGSGTGVIFCGIDRYPEQYRGVFLVNDWLRREVYIYRPTWDGAWLKPDRERFEILAHAGGGRSMGNSSGRRFDPVDIEIGPDGAIWISSWGRQYGAHYEQGKVANEGRIYRIWPKAAPPRKWTGRRDPSKDLGSHLPVWRTNAQEALVRRGAAAVPVLRDMLKRTDLSRALETWTVWTLGRIDPGAAWFEGSRNQLIQSLRVQAGRPVLRAEVRNALKHPEPRVRLEAVLAIRRSAFRRWADDMVNLAARETDRLVYYAAWGAIMDLLPEEQRRTLLGDPRGPVRRAALLGLLHQDLLSDEALHALTGDKDAATAQLASKRLGGKARFEHRGRPLNAGGADNVAARPVIVEPVVNPFGRITASTGRAYRPAMLQPGEALYTDRGYRIVRVPAELEGETFLQTANQDADAEGGISVTVELKYASTLFLIDDARAEHLPEWARGKWEPTGLELRADDPDRMRIYKRDAPAGTVVLGTNRDGVKARKGNYLLVAIPRLLAPSGKVTTVEQALAVLQQADPERGRDLFMSRHGTACYACHRMEGRGNLFAPDLSDIGSRADAAFTVRSILEPGADITEGFVLHTVRTRDGKTHSGILVKETGREITLGHAGGPVNIAVVDIASRETSRQSPMPPYHTLLRPQQVADLAAWLGTLKKTKPLKQAGGTFRFGQEGEARLSLFLGDNRIATYLLNDPALSRRAFVNVRTPSGIPVTRPWPAAKGEDHAAMHPGLWLSFGWLDGNDYWRLQSRVAFDGFVQEPEVETNAASFATRDRYLDRDGKSTICIQETRYTFRRVAEGILLHWDATFYNPEREFWFGDQEESGLSLRMARPLTVQHGSGRILNDAGLRDGRGTWGKPFTWIDYSGVVDGKRVGLLIVPHQGNPRASWSHSRDYGALVANPFPRQPKERREPYVKTRVRKGERFRLRYAVLIHEGADRKADPRALYKSVAREVARDSGSRPSD